MFPDGGRALEESGPGSLTCINAALTYYLNDMFGIFASFDYTVTVNGSNATTNKPSIYDDSSCYLTVGVEISF